MKGRGEKSSEENRRKEIRRFENEEKRKLGKESISIK